MNDNSGTEKQAVVGRYLYYPNKTVYRKAEGGVRKNKDSFNSDLEFPLVSIITVCLNSEKTLNQCINSVLSQTYKNIEYIVIDGGSTDSTLNILEQYAGSISYYISEPDNGLYHAMNKGLSVSFGDYILILNSDDWMPDDAVQSLVNAKKYSGADFVSALALYVDQEGNTLETLRSMPFDASTRLRMPLRHETMLLSASIYNDIGEYDVEYRIIADFKYAVKIYQRGYTHYEINRPLLFFRITGVSNANRPTLISERKRLLLEQFPFLSHVDAGTLSDLSTLAPAQLVNLANNYQSKNDFIKSLQRYYLNRRKVTKSWRKSNITLPMPNDNNCLVSVILPIYNAENYIEVCVNSILQQTLSNIEIICINDASTDNSKSLIESICKLDDRFIYLENKNNIGLGASRNRGVRKATGKYIFHIDPDDMIPPTALESLYSHAIKNDSDMIKGAYTSEQLIHGKGGNCSVKKSLCPSSTSSVHTTLKQSPKLLNTTEGHWSYLYKTDFAKQILYPTNLSMGQDSIFIVCALTKAEKITIINDVVYHYRANPASAMNSFSFKKYMDAIEWRRRAWHILNDANLVDIGDYILQRYWSDEFFVYMARSLSKEQSTSVLKKISFVFQEAGLLNTNNNTSPLINKLIKHLLKSQYEQIIAFLKSYESKTYKRQLKTYILSRCVSFLKKTNFYRLFVSRN